MAFIKRFSLAFIILSGVVNSSLSAQVSISDSTVRVSMIQMSYGAHIPNGDLASRFGFSSAIGIDFAFKTTGNLQFSLGGYFIFGNEVKERNILDAIRTQNNAIINRDGLAASEVMFQRGFYYHGKAAYILPIFQLNPNSGPMIKIGAGFLQHQIKIENEDDLAPQISGEYTKGYDRLTNGFSLEQFVGYQILSTRRLVNFYIGFEVIEAFTKNRRTVNFDTMAPDDRQRTDILMGMRFGWIIPLYKKAPREFYFN